MKLEAIMEAIAELPDDQRTALAAWLTKQEMDEWDAQMQKDFSAGGRGVHLIEKVRTDIRTGKFERMDDGSAAKQ
jgi:hypothetical protein